MTNIPDSPTSPSPPPQLLTPNQPPDGSHQALLTPPPLLTTLVPMVPMAQTQMVPLQVQADDYEQLLNQVKILEKCIEILKNYR